MNCSAGKIGTISKGSARANGLSTPPIGCVLHLPGLPGGGSKIYDRSPYGNIGTITGATWTRLPSGLWVLSFDGSDDIVNCGSNAILNITGALTLSAWVNPVGASELGYIIAKGNPTATKGYGMYWGGTSDYLELYFNNTLVSSDDVFVDTGIFVHAAITVDAAGNVTFYRNGIAAGTDTAALQSNTEDLILANRVGGGAAATFFGGYIALPRVYNRALSALEIQKHFNREKHLFGVW